MDLFLDLYGFLSVVLHAAELMARSVLLGSIAFLAFLAVPLAGRLAPAEGAMLLACARRAILWGGWRTLGTVLFSSGLGAVALVGTLGLGAGQAAGAGFVLSALGVMACAVVARVVWVLIQDRIGIRRHSGWCRVSGRSRHCSRSERALSSTTSSSSASRAQTAAALALAEQAGGDRSRLARVIRTVILHYLCT